MPPPQPGELTSGKRPRREKLAGSGRDFEPGQNSHDGTMFRRGPDHLPRGNMTLYFKCLYHDQRQKLYERHRGIIATGTDRDVLELTRMIADRIEGTPSKKVSSCLRFTRGYCLLLPRLGAVGAQAAQRPT